MIIDRSPWPFPKSKPPATPLVLPLVVLPIVVDRKLQAAPANDPAFTLVPNQLSSAYRPFVRYSSYDVLVADEGAE